MKAVAVALALCLAVPCMAQDVPLVVTDGKSVIIPNEAAILLAKEMKACEAEKKSLKDNAQSAPALIIIAAVVAALAVGVGVGFAVEPLTHK